MRNKLFSVQKIVSGGQTGADRAAWDFALANGIPIGGYVPNGRVAEDGPIDVRYEPLTQTATDDPAERTKLNVLNSDATLVIHRGKIFGGTRLTLEFAQAQNKPCLTIDLTHEREVNIETIKEWLENTAPVALNVAGPRESDLPGIYRESVEFLLSLLKE